MFCVCFQFVIKININKTFFTGADKKELLKNVSGKFRSCELSAVVGQSGCGKTSLLNVLSGYSKCISSGRVVIGDGDNQRYIIKNLCKYIMQNYSLHRFITVREAMNFAANLKLHGISNTCKNYKVREIIESIIIYSIPDTITD